MSSSDLSGKLYDIQIEERTLAAANPFQIIIQISYMDQQFEEYIREVCVVKQVVLYEMHDPMLTLIRKPAFVLRIDRLDEIRKFHKGHFNPNMAFQLDLTQPLMYGFEKEKIRMRFKKQITQHLRLFLSYEAKQFLSLQKKLRDQHATAMAVPSSLNAARKISEDVTYDVHVSDDGLATPIIYDRKL
ncbi:hypothetical protein [Pseudobacillus badius]|uniref:hypothetical protein n=1 Tax=Bacillus badius TaxID=1455 RepID=UPI003D358E69